MTGRSSFGNVSTDVAGGSTLLTASATTAAITVIRWRSAKTIGLSEEFSDSSHRENFVAVGKSEVRTTNVRIVKCCDFKCFGE